MNRRYSGMTAAALIGLLTIPSWTRAQLTVSDRSYLSLRAQIVETRTDDRAGVEGVGANYLTILGVGRSTISSAQSDNLELFGNFGNNFLDSFKGSKMYLQLGAVAATALIIPTGVDYGVEHFFNTHPEYGRWAHPVVFTGAFLPFVAGGSLLAYGAIGRDKQVLGASFAVIQASVIELMYNSALKAITGRPPPDWRHVSNMDSLSRTFRFGFLRGGVFWGWPSGHTAATTAVVSALMGYYPHSTWIRVAGFGLIAYTIFGVSATNRGGMHWFSDAVAGALMSYAVGSTVGKYYREVYSSGSAGRPQPAAFNISPETNPLAINFSFQF